MVRFVTYGAIVALGVVAPALAGVAQAAPITVVSTFATGGAVGATGPDSISVGDGSVWVSYTNGADSTGAGGSSTVVRYAFSGAVQTTFTISGNVDGLKVSPNGTVWALQNNDGNSTLSLINPHTNVVSGPIPYAVTSRSQGFDDVAFLKRKIFQSYTNPTGPTSPTIQQVLNVSNPINVSPVLLMNATGTNLATGATNQPTTQNDPDSLKTTPKGGLMLSSGADGQIIFLSNPATPGQTVSFLQLLDPSTGGAVTGLDDAIFATATNGIFYLADTGHNRVLKISATGLTLGSLFASVGSLNEFTLVDQATGDANPFITGLSAPHGVDFVPAPEPASLALLGTGLLGLLGLRRRAG